jgi:hypothetical protein
MSNTYNTCAALVRTQMYGVIEGTLVVKLPYRNTAGRYCIYKNGQLQIQINDTY